jgi:hypothetical protein
LRRACEIATEIAAASGAADLLALAHRYRPETLSSGLESWRARCARGEASCWRTPHD